MTPISEQDQVLLEQWLDGELSEEQSQSLRQRLAAEPQLAQELDRLRSQRELRARFWQEIEPGDLEVQTLIDNVRRAVRREQVWATRLHTLRRVSGIAASIAIVFMAGWMTRGKLQFGLLSAADPHAPSQFVWMHNPTIINPSPIGLLPPNNNSGIVQAAAPTVAAGAPRHGGAYQVYIVDASGRIVHTMPLDQMLDPRQFTSELTRWQQQQAQTSGEMSDSGGLAGNEQR
ncbi:anti-sigma factor family protein [Fontivita pretiosa]|uniref:anti-sigma factor family protein n=1 Tax=Fontivita pretiosa TaxID=2989684 RepID=UPI003D1859E1